MFDFSTLSIFFLAAAVLCITPGPAVLYVVTRSVGQGRSAGLISVSGIALGGTVHVMAAAFGFSALLMTSVWAFNIVKMIGALYLVYLGVKSIRNPSIVTTEQDVEPDKLWNIFREGALVQIFNPKAALFLFAFLPQFINPAQGNITEQTLILGFLFVLIALSTDALYAIAAGSISQWLKNNLSYMKKQRYISGMIYIMLGVATALTGNRK